MSWRRKEQPHVADRETSSDSGDTGPSEGAGFDPISYAYGGTIAGPVYWGTGISSPNENPGEDPGIERIRRADPLRGWKVAGLQFNNGRVLFVPLTQGSPYRANESQAMCTQGNSYYSYSSFAIGSTPQRTVPLHYTGPELKCTCGFYAHKDKANAEATHGYAVLEVDLYGTVIEHETGYRAAKQRVLSAELSGRCFYCPDDGLLLGLMGQEVPLTIGPLWPLCGAHAHLAPVTIERDHLAGLLGTEVRWAAI